jgi:hypothetical protein
MPLDPGRYRGRIRDYGVTQSQAGQQLPTVFIAFDLIGQYDPTTGELQSCPANTRTYFKSVSARTIDWLLSDLRAIGYDSPGLEFLDPETPGAANLFHREIDVVCDHETYQGQTRERWSIFREQRRERIGRDALARLDAQFADQIRRVLGTTQSAAPAPAVTNVNNEDPI